LSRLNVHQIIAVEMNKIPKNKTEEDEFYQFDDNESEDEVI
jgi:hypothetical protein